MDFHSQPLAKTLGNRGNNNAAVEPIVPGNDYRSSMGIWRFHVEVLLKYFANAVRDRGAAS
jgi:hypothetical protein